MIPADEVRAFCRDTYVNPARARGEETIRIRSGDVHAALGYRNRYPSVCAAIGSNTFEELCGISRVSVEGPLNSANTVFTFGIVPAPQSPEVGIDHARDTPG